MRDVEEQDKTKWITLEELLGIPKSSYPEPQSIPEESLIKLNKSIIDLWNSHNIEVDLPIDKIVPIKLYEALLCKWHELVPAQPSKWLLEFCSFDKDRDCMLSDVCSFCKTIDEEDTAEIENK